jgi:glyoxylase-like metal-dependent hydrolase (beta-lactamase superfamily II)
VANDILTIADRLWRGELSTASLHPVDHIGGFVEITDGVGFTPSFANVSAFDTGDGLVLVDTGSLPLAAVVHGDIRRWSSARLDTAIYSHGHIDHVFGVPVWEAEAKEQGWATPEVIAHHALPARFDRYIFTAGYNTIINRRQFGFKDLNWPTTYRYPDRTYHETLDLSVGGTQFALRHEKGETDDHTITWQADSRVLCCGDLFIWASPNAGNPQKVQRYPREWAQALRRMLTLNAEFLLPGHGLPVIGADRVRQALTDTADLLDSLVDQTLAVMNAGGRLDDAIHSVHPPAELEARPYLRPVYDEPEFVVHSVWRQYGGWWDGNPATLKPAPERALAAELADLAGGAVVLADRALELLAQATALGAESKSESDDDDDDGQADQALRVAGHLAESAWLASPHDPAVQQARQQVFSARAGRASSTMARGVFNWAANESAKRDPEAPAPPAH